MKIQEVVDKITWEKFVQSFRPNNFLASWAWGDFHARLGDKIFRLGLFDSKERLLGVCLAIKVVAKRGSFILCPSGPLLQNMDSGKMEFFVSELKKLAQKETVNFLRVRPLIEAGKLETSLQNLGFRPSPIQVHAQ